LPKQINQNGEQEWKKDDSHDEESKGGGCMRQERSKHFDKINNNDDVY
jgi:hypothetical protein